MSVITSLVASWEMDEASGNAIDSHGDNDLTDNNTVGTNGSGWRDFEADTSEYFSIGDNAPLSASDRDISIEAWVNAESLGEFRFILDKNDGSGSNRSYGIYYDSSADRFKAYVTHDGTNANQVFVTANNLGAPSPATVYQIVFWHDSVNNQIALKVNDGTADTTAHTLGIFNDTAPLQVGASNAGTFWDGLMRRVRFWDKVLTGSEITWLYNTGSGRSYADIVAEADGGTPFFTRIGAQRI